MLAHDAAIPLISMNANENFEDIYRKLENLNQEDLLRFSKTKIFDWANLMNYCSNNCL